MAAVWLRFRSEIGARWRSGLAIALLIGVAAGVALAAAAGARRTDTAFTRLLEATRAHDVLVNPDLGTESALDARAVERLPQVTEVGRVDGYFVSPADIRSESDFTRFGVVLASDGHAAYAFARPKVLDGRLPRRDRADEVLINPVLADRERLSVGDRVTALGFSREATESTEEDSAAPETGSLEEQIAAGERAGLVERFDLEVSGIGISPEEIVVDEAFEGPAMLLSPAFGPAHPDVDAGYFGIEARVRGEERGIAAFRRAVEAMVPDEAIAFQTTTNTVAKVERAVQPHVGALTIFAIVIALTALLVVGQAIARQSFLDAQDHSTLHALGCSRHQLFVLGMVRVVPVACAGAIVAVVVAYALSPLTPIGPARTAEPDPGLRFDPLVLGAGALGVGLLVLALAIPSAWRWARVLGSDAGSGAQRASRVVGGLAGSGAPVPAVAGVRMAVEPGRGRTAVPTRTTIMSTLLAVMVVVAAVVVAASLDHLVETPRLYGWNWDLQITVTPPGQAVTEGDAAVTTAAGRGVSRVLRASPAVDRWATITLSDVRLARGSVPAVGIDPDRRIGPTVVSGRLPRDDREIALGARTLEELGVSEAAAVEARRNDGSTARLRVVGRVVLPGLGTYSGSDKTALGEGAVVTQRALGALGPRFTDATFLVDFAPNSTRAARDRVVDHAYRAGDVGDPGNFHAVGVQKPSDIRSYERVRSTPIALAVLLAVISAVTVGHALVTSVRRRRRDFALLKTLGFTRRQVSTTVAWQATTVGVVALLVGVPLGLVLGRWAWTTLADSLGTVAEPIVPALAVLAAIPVVLVLVNLVAFAPGRVAARLRPATVLRAE